MFTKLAPSAVRPPSPKSRHCTISTAPMTTAPAQGPSMIAASVPPIRWPETPSPTGKLIICAAKTNAAIVPIKTVVRSPSRLSSFRSPTANPAAATTAVAAATRGSSTASGMCIEETPERPHVVTPNTPAPA